ncbi:MAG: hypothetical protein ACRD0U_12105, partial [Acidimicrobiales bacterium]
AYRARALAQAHPLTELAARFVDRAVQTERASQPLAEFALWASAALRNGYCVRRVEEEEAGCRAEPDEDGSARPLDDLDRAATLIAEALRTGDPAPHLLGEEERTVAALDRIVASEVERRLDYWRESVDDEAWGELEEYLTWWVVKGYALRVAETSMVVPQ